MVDAGQRTRHWTRAARKRPDGFPSNPTLTVINLGGGVQSASVRKGD